MKSTLDHCLIGIDFESTGVSYNAGQRFCDEPIEIGLSLLNPGSERPTKLLESFLNHTSPISHGAQRVHGITHRDTFRAPSLLSFWPLLQSLHDRGAIFVSHNNSPEKRFLKKAFPLATFQWLDSLALARIAMPDAASHRLQHICVSTDLFGILVGLEPSAVWHRAYPDALASLLLAQHFLTTTMLGSYGYEQLKRFPVPKIHRHKSRTVPGWPP